MKAYHTIELIEKIIDWKIKEEMPRREIIKRIMTDNNYGISYAYRLMNDANKKIKEIQDKIAEDYFTNCYNSLEQMKYQALQSKDYRLAFDIQKEIDKVTGQYKEKIEHTGNVVFKTFWGDEPTPTDKDEFFDDID